LVQTLNPVWHEEFTFYVYDDETLHVEAWDKDKFLRDDSLGNATINLSGDAISFCSSFALLSFLPKPATRLAEFAQPTSQEVWITLNKVECGELHLKIWYRPFADDLQKSFMAVQRMSSC